MFPIRLDGYVLSPELTELHRAKVGQGAWRPWLERVRAYWIADFSQWKEHEAYLAKFEELVRELKEPRGSKQG